MIDLRTAVVLMAMMAVLPGLAARGQEYGPPDRDQPGDEMIQAYLSRIAETLDGRFLEGVKTAAEWEGLRDGDLRDYFYMLGLSPMPERSPLRATVTGTVEGDGYAVENLHYQSVPGLYVTANLYRPARVAPGTRLPAVLYVCGHSGMGRNGNKTAFQSHGLWFARHGYACLVVDTLQLGEIPGVHHGTYREGRWWWHSRGYTSAGVECWNGVRGIDYLAGRPDVDPERIAVTGISGGGAATFWIAAADERVKVAVPVSGMADLESYVGNRVVNGHCDCMFLYNTFEWPWTRIAALAAPRPMLFVNSDQDRIFPMDANERIIARLERLYSLFGAGDRVDAVVSVGGHDYREDIRRSAYRFHNAHLKGDARPVEDSEVDLVSVSGGRHECPIPPEKLRAFPTDSDIPADQKNTTIDRSFVPMAKVDPPAEGAFPSWKARLLGELRRVTFRPFPERVPAARPREGELHAPRRLETEEGISVHLRHAAGPPALADAKRIVLVVAGPDADPIDPARWTDPDRPGDAVYVLQPRGVGPTLWTRKDPPNYVARAHVLLGRTVDSGRVWDVAATARYLREAARPEVPIVVAGERAAGLIGAYAALLEPGIGEIALIGPHSSHMDEGAPALLNVLRVLDVRQALGMLAPRPLTLVGAGDGLWEDVSTIYARAGAKDHLQRR
jgi:dienelactone hydrolase